MAKVRDAVDNGYDGMRYGGMTAWLKNDDDRRAFTRYEEKLDAAIASHRVLALCSHCLDDCDVADLLEILPSHGLAIAKRDGLWKLIDPAVRKRSETDHKRVEEALRKSETKFRGIAERSLDAIFITDVEGAVTYISPAVEKILQYQPEEMIGRNFVSFLVEEESPQVSQALLKHMKRRRGELFETTVLRKDGSRAILEINASYVVEHKKIIGAQGILRNITERKQAQKGKSTAQKEAAEAANRAKSEFLANMSHEIRTPMTSILGFADLLMTPDLSPQERQEFVETIRRNGKALLELIGEILDLSERSKPKRCRWSPAIAPSSRWSKTSFPRCGCRRWTRD